MAEAGALTVVRRRMSPVAAPTADMRASAFRKAQRHTVLVRVLRIALPVLAVSLFATYGISVRMTIVSDSGGQLTLSVPTISGEDLTMNRPAYDGFNKDGSRFHIEAETAKQDIRQTGPVRLDVVTGRITQPDGTATVVKARKGDFEVKSGVLLAYDGIDIASQSGMTAKLSRATVRTKEGVVVSDEPVLITMPTGQIRGNKMELRQKVKEVTFTDGVVARLISETRPEPRKEQQPAGRVAPQSGSLLAGSGAPIDITSERLDLDDGKKIAIFRGGVKAAQGDSTLIAPELEVHYDGNPAPGTTSSPAEQKAAAASPDQGKLKKLIARTDIVLTRGADVVRAREATFEADKNLATLTGGVVVTSPPDRRATGDQAEVDTVSNRIRLIGNVDVTAGTDRRATADLADIDQRTEITVLTGRTVVVTQGQNVLRGKKLSLDRKGGTSEMFSPGDRVTAHFVRPVDPAQAARQSKTPAAPGFGSLTFSTDPNAPIDVDADALFVNDTAKTATFRGDVKAVQGDFVVRTPELVATYTGQMSMAGGAAAPPAAKGDGAKSDGGGTQLQNIRANRKVVVTSKDQTVTGEWANFDVKANQVTIGGGDVVVTQGRNVIRGPRLVIDMTTGQSRMEQIGGGAAVSAAQPTGDATAAPPSAQPGVINAGRVGAVFYPKELKELKEKRAREAGADPARKKAEPAASPAAPAPTPAPPAATAPVPPRSPATSGWNADNEVFGRSN